MGVDVLPARKGSLKILLFIWAGLLLAGSSFLYLESQLRPAMMEVAEARARQMTVLAMSEALRQRVDAYAAYSELVYVHKDQGGKVVLVQPNAAALNRLAVETTLQVQEALAGLAVESFSIPVGQAFKSPILASCGPRIGFKIRPLGNVEVRIDDRFEAMGINQTRHSIFLTVESRVLVVLPLVSKPVSVTASMLVAESIIVGEVPQAYLNLK